MKKILAFGSTFPSSIHPIHGVFVKERVKHVSLREDCQVKVISPVPYFPPIKSFQRWYSFSQIPNYETIDGLDVLRPKYLLLPKIGSVMHAYSMALFSKRAIFKVKVSMDFDLIDAHFVYPDGVAAAFAKRRLNRPLVITGRGEDILSFPDLPVVGNQIRWALKEADALVALSGEIAEAMIKHGASEKKITIIPNGVDSSKFKPLDQEAARKELNLPLSKKIIVSVGYRLERKGFHLLVDALPEVKKHFPDVYLVFVGGVARWGQDYTSVIKERIDRYGLRDNVLLAGACPPERLLRWYSAGDIFALMTSREGSPNVLMEALSCGLPSVATPVGGIPQILDNPDLGVLLKERTADDAAKGIIKALSTDWDKSRIRRFALDNSWQNVAGKVNKVFNQVLNNFNKY